jgi:hypothetical protein
VADVYELLFVLANRRLDIRRARIGTPALGGDSMSQQVFTMSLFESVGDTRPQMKVCTWPQLCAGFAKPKIREEKDGQLFSPARYRAPRRLIANVIELSLLVLEVDGAWKCEGSGTSLLGECGHKGPLVMFRNARRQKDHCPRCKQDVTISQINFDLESLAAACRNAFPSAFALYSTHSHKRSTYNNALAEPRFRIVVPLTEPVPVADFLELWYAAVESLTEIPADPQVKDPNRIYYTPVKFNAEAPYEFHIEPGEPLDWKKFLVVGSFENSAEPKALAGGVCSGHSAHPSGQTTPLAVLSEPTDSTESKALATEAVGVGMPKERTASLASEGAPSTVLNPGDIYASHEARHEEMCRRIAVRGKQNSRGNYDARCLAHGGKGTTAVLYNPRSEAVSCNRGCTYQELLVAEGLDDRKLPTAARAAVWQAATVKSAADVSGGPTAATRPSGSGKNPVAIPSSRDSDSASPLLSLAKLHVINALLLAHLFELSPEDETTVRRYWGDPFSEEIEWPGTDTKQRVKVCSFPSRRLQLEAVRKISQEFNLEGVPGIYNSQVQSEFGDNTIACLGPEGKQRRAEFSEYGPWRIALDQYRMKPGALLTPYDNNSGYICGLRIHRNIRDKCPFLLTSRGLPGGGKAIAYREVTAA